MDSSAALGGRSVESTNSTVNHEFGLLEGGEQTLVPGFRHVRRTCDAQTLAGCADQMVTGRTQFHHTISSFRAEGPALIEDRAAGREGFLPAIKILVANWVI
jgi:hypothetical protein